jgi:transcriptional regulator with XRE-family HTH domain
MKFVETLDHLISEHGITRNKLLLDIKANRNSFVNWEQRGNIPNGKMLTKISQYFKVPIDNLLDNQLFESSKYESALDKHTQHVYDKYDEQLLNLFHLLNEEGQEKIMGLIDDLASSQKYIKTDADGVADKEKRA